MKKTIIYLFISVIALGSFAFVEIDTSPKKSFKESFMQILKNSKAYTVEVAEKMPDRLYTYRPSDSVRTFGEQMAHIGMSNQMILNKFIKGIDLNMDPAESKKMEQKVGANKAECINLLKISFDNAIDQLESMDDAALQETFVFVFSPDKPELTKQEGFMFLRDHITHHRGQAIIYLRMRGFIPPQYRAF